MATILVTHGVPMTALEQSPCTLLRPKAGGAFTRGELMDLLPQADCVLACGAFDGELMAKGSRLKLIVCYGAGYDKIDIARATELGILVCNTPDSVTKATAEVAIALIMAVTRRICELDGVLRQEGSAAFGMGKRMGRSLFGHTLGIVGMGRIGGVVADFGRLMGMDILYTARSEHESENQKGARRVPLSELLAASDVVSLHCPLTDETRGMISESELRLMKPGAVLINTARGAIVDEQALISALQSGVIAGAGLDVFTDEPNVPVALRELANVVLTPHIGSNTLDTREEMARAALHRFDQLFAGQTPDNALNHIG